MHLLKANRPFCFGIALLVAAAAGCAPHTPAALGLADRANANASIVASGEFVGLAWGATTPGDVTDIYAATSRDGGRTFSPPSRVNQVPGDANLSGEQPPRITLVPRQDGDPALVVVWTAKADAGTRLLSARSDDGGRSFAPAVPVPGSEAPGNRGWHTVATNRDGRVLALWLDHRQLATGGSGSTPPMHHEEHEHLAADRPQADGVARAQLSRLFFGWLDEPDGSRALASGVCYCCKTAMATDARGGVFAAWRHVYAGNMRDIAFTMSSDGGRTFAEPLRVSEDHWSIDGCPENGPALAVDADSRVHVVWPTLVAGATPSSEPTPALFYATSTDGRRFTPRERIPTEGVPRHPQMAIGAGGDLTVVWDEQAIGVRRIAMARRAADGTFARRRIGDAAPAVYPVVASGDAGAIVAWTSGSAGRAVIRTERLENER